MKQLSIAILLSISLAGCATQFGTKTVPTAYYKPPVIVAKPRPVPDVAPGKTAKTFKQRWESKFFRDRAQQK